MGLDWIYNQDHRCLPEIDQQILTGDRIRRRLFATFHRSGERQALRLEFYLEYVGTRIRVRTYQKPSHSNRVFAPFERLHGMHAGAAFSSVVLPPLAQGHT